MLFRSVDGVLHAENVPIPEIAKAVGTPFYCYSTATLERHYDVFSKAFADVDAMVCYAMKANSNQAVLKTLGRLGAGVDVVSGGELRRALAAGLEVRGAAGAGRAGGRTCSARAEPVRATPGRRGRAKHKRGSLGRDAGRPCSPHRGSAIG